MGRNHVGLVEVETASTPQNAVREALLNLRGLVEVSAYTVDGSRHSYGVKEYAPVTHRGKPLGELRASVKDSRQRSRGRRWSTGQVEYILIHLRQAGVLNISRKPRHGRLQIPLLEVVNAHGALDGGEVHADMLLGRHGKGLRCLGNILSGHGRSGRDGVLVRIPYEKGSTVLCALDSEAAVVLLVDGLEEL